MENDSEEIKFNAKPVKEYLKKEMRKSAWIAKKIEISPHYFNVIMSGRVPSRHVIRKISRLIAVPESLLVNQKITAGKCLCGRSINFPKTSK